MALFPVVAYPQATAPHTSAAVRAKSSSECRKLIIDAVRVRGASHLPDAVQAQLGAALHGQQVDECSQWTNDVEAKVLRLENEAWPQRESQGFMDMAVGVTWKLVDGSDAKLAALRSASPLHVVVTVEVYEGRQKALSEIEFVTSGEYSVPPVTAPIFDVVAMRQLIPLREGEPFRRDKLQEGLQALARAYGAKGFIDCSVGSSLEVDATNQTVRVVVNLDEGPRYRVGSVEVIGLDPATDALLRAQLPIGEPVDPRVVDKFFAVNRLRLPAGASPQTVSWQRDKQRAVVDFSFDFRTATAVQP